MKINAIKCKGCGDIVFSRAVHDMRFCHCCKTAQDGGFLYQKIAFDPDIGYEHVDIDLPVTKEELYDDWNKGLDKFGVVYETKVCETKNSKENKNKKKVADKAG